MPTQASPFKRPYTSRRGRRKSSKKDSTKSTSNKLLLRMLAALLLILIIALTVIFKGIGSTDYQKLSEEERAAI